MLQVNISITEPLWEQYCPNISALIEKSAQKAFVHVNDFNDDNNVLLSIKCTNDIEIQELNKKYRSKDKPTNVLSFPQLDDNMIEIKEVPLMLGDIVLAFQTIHKEAKEQEKTIESHISHLITHGVLHLFGFDHIDDSEAEEMEKMECIIMHELGYDNPYF